MKKTALAFILILLSSAFLYSQDWTGQGRQIGFVYDMEGNPLEGVTVKLFFTKTQSGFEVKTDNEGKWVAFGVKGGTWWVDFEMEGYMPKKITTNILDFRQRNEPISVNLEKMEGLYLTDDLKEVMKQGNALFDEKKFDEARTVFSDILVKFPDAYILNLNIGNCYFEQENYVEAMTYYQKVLEKAPDNVDALMGVGNCYSNLDDHDKALEWYSKIAFEKIKDPVVLYNVGTIFYNSGQPAEALKYYKRSVELQEDFLDGIYQLGLAYLATGANKDALTMFEKYLQQDSTSDRATQVKGFIDYLKRKTAII